MTNPTLSLAAQAVLSAYDNAPFSDDLGDRAAIAVALRAAANAVPIPSPYEEDAFHSGWWKALERIRAIATELETTND
jgi:hypothetical protein